MIKFENDRLGKVIIRFRHYLPSVFVPPINNSLASIVNGIKLQQGYTECKLQLDCDDLEYYGIAKTHPVDHYKKETGRVLSLTRAVEAMLDDGYGSNADGRAIMSAYYSR